MTRPWPTVARISLTLRSTNEEIVQSGLEAGQLEEEVAQDLEPFLGVDDLGVELDAVELPLLVLDHGGAGVGRARRSGGSRAGRTRAGRRGSSRPAPCP